MRPKTWKSPDDAECSKCGRIHTRQTCPAQDKTCHNCGKPNHFAAMCRSTAPTQSAAVRQRKRPQRVHEINDVKIEPKLPRYDLEDSVRVHETLTTSDLSEEVGVFEILHTAVTDARIEKVRAAMQHDQSMQVLIRTIQSGWPNERRRCPKEIQDFWNIRD